MVYTQEYVRCICNAENSNKFLCAQHQDGEENVPITLEARVPRPDTLPQREQHPEFSENPLLTFLYGFLPLCIPLNNIA